MSKVIRQNRRQQSKGDELQRDTLNDFVQLLVGEADHSNEFSSLQGSIMELNRGCDHIFRVGGSILQATANFIGGEADQNSQTRGESQHIDHT
jgi:hypothetical protein